MVDRQVEAALAGLHATHAATSAASAAHAELTAAGAGRRPAAFRTDLNAHGHAAAHGRAGAAGRAGQGGGRGRGRTEGPRIVEAAADVLALETFEIQRTGVEGDQIAADVAGEAPGQGGLEVRRQGREGGDGVLGEAPGPGRADAEVGLGPGLEVEAGLPDLAVVRVQTGVAAIDAGDQHRLVGGEVEHRDVGG